MIFSSTVSLFSASTQSPISRFLAGEKINVFLEEAKYAPTYISRLSTESFNFRNSAGIYIYLCKVFLVSVHRISFVMLWPLFCSSFRNLNNFVISNIRRPLWFPACFHAWTLTLRVFSKCALWASLLEGVICPRSTCFLASTWCLRMLQTWTSWGQDGPGFPNHPGRASPVTVENKAAMMHYGMIQCNLKHGLRKDDLSWFLIVEWTCSRMFSRGMHSRLIAWFYFGILILISVPFYGPKCHRCKTKPLFPESSVASQQPLPTAAYPSMVCRAQLWSLGGFLHFFFFSPNQTFILAQLRWKLDSWKWCVTPLLSFFFFLMSVQLVSPPSCLPTLMASLTDRTSSLETSFSQGPGSYSINCLRLASILFSSIKWFLFYLQLLNYRNSLALPSDSLCRGLSFLPIHLTRGNPDDSTSWKFSTMFRGTYTYSPLIRHNISITPTSCIAFWQNHNISYNFLFKILSIKYSKY